MKVAKFGGTSLANARQIKKVVKIIKSDPERRCIVVSAPGKRNLEDDKITELLYAWARSSTQSEKRSISKIIIGRYQKIFDGLGLWINFKQWFNWPTDIFEKLPGRYMEDYIVSRGEYWMAKIMAKLLGYAFIDAAAFIVFDKNGLFNLSETKKRAKKIHLQETARKNGVVVPGFYGSGPLGGIRTFSRGGSDVTGAIVASCVHASLYENWTDVSGVLMADPRIINKPCKIPKLTYRELRELAYMGANVLHDESIFPVRSPGIPINVRNTNRPKNKGTLIVPEINQEKRAQCSIVGIAGKKGFSVIRIEKTLMDNEVGFLRQVCQIMEKHEINIEHVPGGIDTLSVIVERSTFDPLKDRVLNELKKHCKPDVIHVERNMALICIVVSSVSTPGLAAKIFKAVALADVNIRMINQGSSEISIIIGVDEKDYEATIRAVYKEFAK